MPYTVQWLVDDHIVHVQVHGKLSIADIVAVSDLTNALFAQAHGRVYMIVGISSLQLTEFDLTRIAGATASLRNPVLERWFLYGNSNPMFYYMGRTVARMTGSQVAMSSTLDQALDILYKLDPSLPQLATLQPTSYPGAE